MKPATSPELKRLRSLDGLRGIAALVVVTQHILISTPAVYTGFVDDPEPGWVAALSFTPLRLFWAGSEAVWVFFILSGFVLSRKYVNGARLASGRYLLRRSLRIYVPTTAAIALGVALTGLPRTAALSGSPWLESHREAATTGQILKTVPLLFGDKIIQINGALWSLQWEMWFSLLLPVVVIVAIWLRRYALAWGVLCIAVAAFGAEALEGVASPAWVQLVRYLPMFGVGVALACYEPRIHRAAGSLTPRVGAALLTVSVLALSIRYPIDHFEPLGEYLSQAIGLFVSVTAGAAVIILALVFDPFSRALERPVVQWVGVRSFSLYLVHEPVIMAVMFATGAMGTHVLGILVLYAAALAVAALFYRAIEEPTVRMGHRWFARRDQPLVKGPGASRPPDVAS